MGDVRSALEEANYDMERAYEVLRKKGVAAAAKKSSRTAGQGLIGVAREGGCAVLVEVNSETDFVARSDAFKEVMPRVLRAALRLPTASSSGCEALDVATLAAAQLEEGEAATVGEAVTELAAHVRENVQLRRGLRLFSPGHIATYVHNALTPATGLIGAAVALESSSGALPEAAHAELEQVGKHLAMQIVAMTPVAVTRDGVPADLLFKEREILTELARKEGKPDKFLDKMVEGRMGKFYEENVLLDQKYILDDKQTVRKVVAAAGARLGVDLVVSNFIYMKLGDSSS